MTTLREAAQQALETLESWSRLSLWDAEDQKALDTLRAALEQPEQEPVACFIGIKGSAFDLPTTKRAYTYEEQPGNVVAWKLGQALETAKRFPPGGDSIDDGLALLKTLQAEGFGVFQLGAEYTALRDALEEPEQEWLTGCPRCGMDDGCDCEEGTYNPPRREWQSLTDQEITDIFEAQPRYHYPPICPTDRWFARDIEAALKEKNYG